jgi:hypothetical protein
VIFLYYLLQNNTRVIAQTAVTNCRYFLSIFLYDIYEKVLSIIFNCKKTDLLQSMDVMVKWLNSKNLNLRDTMIDKSQET